MIAEQLRGLSRPDLGGPGRCGEGTAVLEHGGGRYLYLAHEQPPANFSEEIIFGAFFSAGVRAFGIRDPFQPRQVAAFEPAGPVQTNDVYVTADGIVYPVDRDGGGRYILEYSGPG